MKGTTPPLHRLFALAAVGTALITTTPAAKAVQIAGDSFFTGTGGYIATGGSAANLTSQPAGGTSPNSSGFSGTFGLGQTGLMQPVTAGLTYNAPGYSGATGGAIRLTSSDQVTSGLSRHLLRAIDPGAARPDTLYFSGLIQVPTALGSSAGGFFEFSNRPQNASGQATLTGANLGFEFGVLGTSFVLNTAAGGNLQNSTLPYTPLVGNTTADTNLFVLKLEIDPSGTDKFTLYLNPTDLTSESQAFATAAFKTEITGNYFNSGDFLVNFGFRTQSSGLNSSVNVYADEVRIGTTFGDVVTAVVPEPSLGTLLLAGMGVLAAGRRRRATQA